MEASKGGTTAPNAFCSFETVHSYRFSRTTNVSKIGTRLLAFPRRPRSNDAVPTAAIYSVTGLVHRTAR